MSGPTPEHVDPKAYGGDPFQDDPRILPAFNGSSPSGDVTADVVYANYGTLADFDRLKQLGIDVKGKIVIVRYGAELPRREGLHRAAARRSRRDYLLRPG